MPNKDLTIGQILDMKALMDKTISNLLNDFYKTTDLAVGTVQVKHSTMWVDDKPIDIIHEATITIGIGTVYHE